jgi:hypothetical protein
MISRGTATAVLLATCVVLLAAPTAQADWEQVPLPGGGIREMSAASRDSLIVAPTTSSCCPTFNVTANRGASWTSVQLAGFSLGAILGGTSDGSFRVLTSRFGGATTQELQVFKLETSGAFEALGPVIPTDGGFFSASLAALDDEGAVWVPTYDKDTGAWRMEIVAADGSSTSKALPSIAVERWQVFDTAFGPRAVPVAAGSTPGLPQRGTFRLGVGGSFEPAEAYPVEFADGDYWYSASADRASWDAGAHWSEVFENFGGVVSRTTGPARLLATRDGVVERYSPFIYSAAGSSFPAGVQIYGVVDAGSALALRTPDAVYVEPLPLGPAPRAIGEVPADSAALIARADLFRADAGLPPLTGDALISKAAANHSRYTALNDTEASLSAHGETPGRPGFTGSDPSQRCEAVGTQCGGEVMYAPVADPVGGWLATVYHRTLPGGPEVGLVGGGKVDSGWFVMDSGADRNVLIQPFGYPVGRWRGEDGFSGEIPDPADTCRENGQPIKYPVGVTVTLFLPKGAGVVKSIVVRKRGESKPMPGCLLSGSGAFIPDDPLEKGQTYDVHAEWVTQPDPQADGTFFPGITLARDWSFNFQPDGFGKTKEKQPCRSLDLRTIKSVAPSRRGGRAHQVLGIEEKVTFKQKAVVRLKRAQLNYWKAHRRYSLKLKLGKLAHRPVKVGRTSLLRFRLPPSVVRRVIPGEDAEMWLKFSGRRASGCKRVAHVARVRKIKLGWVQVAGPAAWVSAKHKHHRRGHGRRPPRG